MEKVVIVGAGNPGKLILDIIFKRRYMLLEEIHVLGFLDENLTLQGELIHGTEVIGTLASFLSKVTDSDLQFIIAEEDLKYRKEVIKAIEAKGYFDFYTAIHPRAVVGNNVVVGTGTIVHSGAIVSMDTEIGEHVIIGAGCMIEIGTCIEDYVTIKPKVIVGEDVYIGENTMLRAGTIVNDRKRIPCDYTSKLGEIIE